MSEQAPQVIIPEAEDAASVIVEEKPRKEKKPVVVKEPPRPIDDVSRLQIIVGKLNRVWEHPEADKLWCEEVDCGAEEPRQIASGLREFYKSPAEMEGKLVLVLANLKPRPMRGFLSQGMLLCASTEDKVELIEAPAGSVPGERILVGDVEGEFDLVLNAKKNPWDALKDFFKTGATEPIALFKDTPLKTSAGIARAATLMGVPIQ